MPLDPDATCRVTESTRRRTGYKPPHRGSHLCVEPVAEDGQHDGWHRCWCGYLWGQHGLDRGDVKMVLR